MSVLAKVILASMLLGFFACCVASALLQLLAWRHVRPGQGPTVVGVWKPENYFDEIGLRQMKLARWLLILGGVLFLSYAILGKVIANLAS
ncbi:MAG TPA: hypothetical protein VFT45_23260 [Longimicrobium sp.]|nr:hypothetical protein [Longimicrobium sp.]